MFILVLLTVTSELNTDYDLNRKAANASDLPDDANFTMANFTYSNNVVANITFKHLQNTSFQGIIVSVLILHTQL